MTNWTFLFFPRKQKPTSQRLPKRNRGVTDPPHHSLAKKKIKKNNHSECLPSLRPICLFFYSSLCAACVNHFNLVDMNLVASSTMWTMDVSFSGTFPNGHPQKPETSRKRFHNKQVLFAVGNFLFFLSSTFFFVVVVGFLGRGLKSV